MKQPHRDYAIVQKAAWGGTACSGILKKRWIPIICSRYCSIILSEISSQVPCQHSSAQFGFFPISLKPSLQYFTRSEIQYSMFAYSWPSNILYLVLFYDYLSLIGWYTNVYLHIEKKKKNWHIISIPLFINTTLKSNNIRSYVVLLQWMLQFSLTTTQNVSFIKFQKGKYQSDRLTLLDESSEDEVWPCANSSSTS